MPSNIGNTGQELQSLSSHITDTSTKIDVLRNVWNKFHTSLQVDSIRKIEAAYGTLNRTLVSTKRETESLVTNITNLSKVTDYYTKQQLVQMAVELKSSTSALTLFNRESVNLISTFTQIYKRDAPEFLKVLNQISDRSPILAARMKSASTSFTTMFEVFKNGGSTGVSAYLASINQMEKETKSTTDNIDDMFNKVFSNINKRALDLSTNFTETFGSLIRTLGTGNLSSGLFGLGALGGALGLRKGLEVGSDFFIGKQQGFLGKAMGALPGVATGGALAYGFSGANPFSNPIEGLLGLGGAAYAGSKIMGPLGAPVGAAFELGFQARNSAIYGGSSKLNEEGFDSELGRRVQGVEEAHKDKSFLGLGGLFGNNSELQSQRIKVIQSYYKEKAAKREREDQIFNMPAFENSLAAASSKVGNGIEEGSSQEAAAFSEVIKNQVLHYQSMLKTDLTREERNRVLGKELPQAYQQLQYFSGRTTRLGQLSLAGAESRYGFAAATGISDIAMNRGGVVSSLRGGLESNIQNLQGEREVQALVKTEEAKVRVQQIDNEILSNKQRLIELSSVEANAEKQLLAFAHEKMNILAEQVSVQGGDFTKVKASRELLLKYWDEEISKTEKLLSVEKNETKQEELRVKLMQEGLQKEQASLAIRQLSVSALQAEVQNRQALRNFFGVGGPEERLGDIHDTIREKQKQLSENTVSGTDRTRVENEVKILQMQEEYIRNTELPLRNIQRQNELISAQAGLYQTLHAPAAALSRIKQQELQGLQQELQQLVKNRDVMQNQQAILEAQLGEGGFKEAMQKQDIAITQMQTKIASSFDFVRRSYAEQYTATMLGMPSGTYLNPTEMSQYSMLGPSYTTGVSQYGGRRGTYQSQLEGIFGAGTNERTSFEHFFEKITGQGLQLSGSVRVDQEGNMSMENAVVKVGTGQ